MKKIVSILLCSVLCATLLAQENKTPEEREKELYESIQKQVDQLTEQLSLEDWQVFYVDSILTHDWNAMLQDFNSMSAAKVSNSDLFSDVQDKWAEQIYNALHKVFNEDQWARYLKSGAARDKKLRDKRAAKKAGKS